MICSTSTDSERMVNSGMALPIFSHQLGCHIAGKKSRSLSRTDGRPSQDGGSINDQRYRKGPQRDACEQRSIGEQEIGRASAGFTLMNEIEIAENSIQRKRDRQSQPRGPKLLLRLWADRIEDISNQCRSRDDGNHLIQ